MLLAKFYKLIFAFLFVVKCGCSQLGSGSFVFALAFLVCVFLLGVCLFFGGGLVFG